MEWLEKIIENVEKGNYSIVMIIILISFIINIKNILAFMEDFHFRKIKRFEQYLENKYIDEDMKSIVVNQLNIHVFKVTTGIRADKFLKKKLIELYEKGQGVFTLKQVSYISSANLDLIDGKVVIKPTDFDNISYYLNIIWLIFTGFFILLLLLVNKNDFNIWLMFIASNIMFFFIIFQIVNYILIKKLETIFFELQKDEE